ncbi:RNI-like protein [Macrolepiota fuliginosa MF-IS2]|uniref:RNI-like protein n=1 Tax=Macrolepiota fuliginosa MF-IS2 TaxID=1400762 RepID=A0A9P5XD95_9AGAR|nr:RNI-like protein [Macrolepiota fuliginosa MF-IS2]
MSRANNVRGPTSALTEFLRQSGIDATSIARRAATRNAGNQQQGGEEPEARPSNSNQADDRNTTAGPSSQPQTSIRGRRPRTRTRSNLRYSGNASDDLDNSEPEQNAEPAAIQVETQADNQTPVKRRKLTKAAEAKLKAKEKKKRRVKDSDDEYIDEDDDAYTAPSRMRGVAGVATGPRPPPGSFETCVKCEKRFTVMVYTMAAIPGPGWLCHPCAKATGNDPFKKPQAAKKNKTDKRTVTSFEERRFPSLVSLCLITKHIDDVEALGDIGSLNVEAISKALSKNRSLTSENAQLFYNTSNTTLALYDATNLSPDAFTTLAYLNPNLTSLRIDFCGQIDDDAISALSTSLPALTSIELLGPFLVRPPAWQKFLAAHSSLERFLITQSPRFDIECLQSLLSSCGPNLRELRLKEIGKLDDEFLRELAQLGQDGNTNRLAYLDISDPGESCKEEAMIELLSSIGNGLAHLNISKHILLTDTFLTEGLLPHTASLDTLILNNLPELTDKGVTELFGTWNNPPLVYLDLSRNHALGDKSLEAILNHSGGRLEELNVNSWKELGEDVLTSLAVKAQELKKVDVGWVREMTDFVVKAWVDGAPEGGASGKEDAMMVDSEVIRRGGCSKLEEVKVWGCNRITLDCPRKKGMSIYGVEAHSVIRTSA